jgi:uncharacterized membrane protein
MNGGNMKLTKCIVVLMLITIAILSVACSSNKGPKKENPEHVIMYYPEWWDSQDNPEFVYTYGEGVKMTSSLAKDAAYANAMLQAANYVEANVKGMIKNFEEESGVNDPQLLALTSSVVKVVSNAKFKGTSIDKSETIKQKDNKIKVFVRVRIPQSEINKQTLSAIKNEEALYNEFKASQRFEELEKELGN